MLKTLYIENIAVIEKSTIDFDNGLNVLTGETGAGKSIIIDAINAVMGRRISKDIIRTGEESAFVSAQFESIGEKARLVLQQFGLDSGEDECLILQRSLNNNGKSNCKVNGRPATAAMLKEIAHSLINIHGQHESYDLFSSEKHIDYIDSYGNCIDTLLQYRKKYSQYKTLKNELDESRLDEGERLREIDLLSFQTKELLDADVTVGESESLESERGVLLSFEKISSLLNKSHILLSGDGMNDGGVETVDSAAENLLKAAQYNPELESLADNLSDISYNLRDCAQSVCDAIESLDSDPQRLEEIEERLDLLNRLSRKYGCPCDELPSLAQQMQSRLDQLLSFDKNRDELEKSVSRSKAEAEALAEELRQLRKKAAQSFAENVKAEMSFLNMPGVELVPAFEETELYSKGIDKIELLISANPGETPRPVAKIASGGELSRMMLAIKTVLANSDTTDTLIFDEVDTGISGSAAEKVGLKLKQAAQSCQVLCVTHQAQIAALADNHYLIRKQVDNGRTFTGVKLLDRNGRINELARIIGGINITDSALSHAESMLDQYKN